MANYRTTFSTGPFPKTYSVQTGQSSLKLFVAGVLIVASIVLVKPASSQISGATKGQPVIATGATTATSDGSFLDATQFTGADMCVKIQAAWAALPTPSGTIDGRGFTGTQACSVSPFNTNKRGILLLGNARTVKKLERAEKT